MRKKGKDQTMKEHKAKIDEGENEKLRFPETEDATTKEVVLESVTKFERVIIDCEVLIPRV